MATIGENLRDLRQAAGLSQTALAERAGVSQQLVSQLERGENERTLELPALAKALGVGVQQIDENYTPEVFAGKVSGEKQIMALLRRIEGLPEAALVPVYAVIAGFIQRDAALQTETPAHDRSEPATRRRELEPLRRQPQRLIS